MTNDIMRKSIYIPKSEMPSPTDDDYFNGYYYRYFYTQANSSKSNIIEIDSDEFNRIQRYYLYKTFKLKWKIAGTKEDVININKDTLSRCEQYFNGITDKLKINYLFNWK